MSAVILQFPSRGPFDIRVEREIDGDAWLVIARSHGWLHGDFVAALRDARDVAAGWGVVVNSSAGVFAL
jgi:hypothetical protein